MADIENKTAIQPQMFSIGFPKIFNGSKVYLSKGYDAVKQNLIALIASDKGALFGDPWYGTKIKTLLWDQTYDPIIRDLIKEDIFEAIYSYMPQITVDRDSIEINVIDNVVMASISVKGDDGVQSNLYEIKLLSTDDE